MRENSGPSEVGVVVIGRNEGERLVRCLQGLAGLGATLVYVDSGSSDGSPARVRDTFGEVLVHELDRHSPFSAARARNEGARVLATYPGVRLIQFIDGDCVMAPAWLSGACAYLEANKDCAAVVGQLEEMHPEASVYNQLCAMEWKSRPGDLEDCGAFGGISMVRASVFTELGGFNSAVIAGEDSEFAVRMRLAGHRVTKLDLAMARHDADMTEFREFWTRAVRSGHAIGQRYDLHGHGPLRDCAKDYRSVLVWGLGLPAVALFLGMLTHGIGLLLWPLGVAWLFSRVAAYRKRLGDTSHNARVYAAAIVATKYAQVIGLGKYWLRRRQQVFQIIEYK